MVIKDLTSLKKFFSKVKKNIIGAGVFAFSRLGPESFLKNYKIFSLYNSKETNLIEKKVEVFCLEKEISQRLRPKNATTLLSHPKTQALLKKIPNPIILVYKATKKLEDLAKKFGFTLAISSSKFGKKFLENKAEFREVLKKLKIEPTPGRIVSFSYFFRKTFFELKKELGLPFVIQHPTSGGGKGTFFILEGKDFSKVKDYLKKNPPQRLILAKFIQGPTPSITGCVTSFGFFSTRPQYQICDAEVLYQRELGSGLFSGHDFSSSDFSKKILKEAQNIIEKFGNYLKKIGYRGIFGLDFVLDEKNEKLYLTECNPRLLGTFPTLTMVQIENGEVPILALHLLEFLKMPCQVDQKKVNFLMWQKKEGSQMILHNKNEVFTLKKEIFPGIYQLRNEKISYKKEGFELRNIQSKEDFLVTDGIPLCTSNILPYQRICRILCKKGVLDFSRKNLNSKAKDFVLKFKEKFL